MVADGIGKVMNPVSCHNCPQRLRVLPTEPPDNPDSVAIITTHYNPCGFDRLRQTFFEWYPTIRLPLITMEMVTGNQPPEIPNSQIVNGSEQNIVWQKEALINQAIRTLPPAVRYVCWIDHDFVFEDPAWLRKAIAKIDSGVDALQPFSVMRYQSQSGAIERTSEGAAAVAKQGGDPGTGPGAVWVASRDWLDRIGGLYWQNIVGGGDAVFFSAVSKTRTSFVARQSPAAQSHIAAWIESIGPVRYDYLQGAIRHIWHGDRENRQYVSRDEILRRFEFDPNRHIELQENGLIRWTKAASPAFRNAVKNYFLGRREDG